VANGGARKRALKAIPESFWTKDGRRRKLWDQSTRMMKAREKNFERMARAFQMRQISDVIEKAKGKPIGTLEARNLLDVKAEAKLYLKTFRGWYEDHAIRAGEAGLRATKRELFDDTEEKGVISTKATPQKWSFKLSAAQEEKLMQMVFNSGTKVAETTIDIIYDSLHSSMSENATTEQWTQQIWEQVDDFSPARARLWATTESTKVENWGELEGYKEAEFVEKKGWNCSFLDTSREDHMNADGQEQLLDDDFEVGGESLAFPGDPRGTAGNVCNCRCSQYPVVEEL
jgi:hypothetical protein